MSGVATFVKRVRDIMRNDPGVNGDAQRIEQLSWMLFLKVYDSKEGDWEAVGDYESIISKECRWRNWAHDKDGKGLTGDALLDFVNGTLFPALKSLPVSIETETKKAVVRAVFNDANNYMKDGVLLRQVINAIDEIDFDDYKECHAFGQIYEAILKELQNAGSSGEFYTPRAVTQFMAQMIKPKVGETMADFACGTGGFLTSYLDELVPQCQNASDVESIKSSVYGVEKKQFPFMLCVTNLMLHEIDSPRVLHDNSLSRDVRDYGEKDKFDVILMNPPYGGNEKADIKSRFPANLASSETADLFMSVIMYCLKKNGRAAVIIPDGFLFGTDNAKLEIKKKMLCEFNLHTVVRLPESVFSPYTSISTNILFFDNTGATKNTWFYRVDLPEGIKHFSKTRPMTIANFESAMKWWEDRHEIAEDGFDKAKCYTAQEVIERGYNLDLCGYPSEEERILPLQDLIKDYKYKRDNISRHIDEILQSIEEKIVVRE